MQSVSRRKEVVYAWLVVAVIALITAIPVMYFNSTTKRGGILDDAILNKQDPYYIMDQQVKKLSSQGLKTGEVISFVIPLEHGVTKKNLGYIKWFTDKLKEAFPEFGILSLSVAADYRDTGEELLNK
ncbi:MAG: hypothetical protein WC610_03850, partial [Patescibacteria group bacterium]